MKTLAEAISCNGEIFNSDEQKTALLQAVSRLPRDQQQVLNLYYYKKVTIKEISRELRCSVTTAYHKLNRALFTLKNEFNPSAYEKMYTILYPDTGKPAALL